MDTTEARTSQDERGPPGDVVYDGFISYSHAADDLLAPRLQAGLQRFAKPWWKRRALRIFRDESSLSANPHLWSSITDALDQSDWFVLLLSPDAADSEWVNQEAEYWLEHKEAGRIIPVVTDGEFTWSETDIDLESTAVPPALYGAFSDEPRWVDLRFARVEEQLDLNNPRFSAAVADIASAIRGVPKDELESEEVLQHRRTVRTVWAAGAGLLILALVAGATAIYALDQRSEAVANANRADEKTAEAEALAEAEAQARQDAQQQTEVAEARELVLEAENVLEENPELSAHLALSALASLRAAGENTVQAVSALRSAIENDRVTFRVPGSTFVAVHPDGSLLATTDEEVGVAVWDIGTREVVERYSRPDDMDAGNGLHSADFSPDGNLLAVSFETAEPAVTIWDRTSGESFHLGTHPGGARYGTLFSPDGAFITIDTGRGTEAGVQVWSVAERRIVYETGETGEGADFNADGLMSYAVGPPFGETGESSVRVVDPATGELIRTFPTELEERRFTQWSPDGTLIAAGDQSEVIVLEVATGAVIARTGDIGRAYWPKWLPDGDAFVVGGEAIPRVIDATTGEVRTELLGLTGGTWDYDFFPGTSLLAAAGLLAGAGSQGNDTVIFEASGLGSVELGGWVAPLATSTADYTRDGERVVVSDLASYVTARALDGGEPEFVEGVFAGHPPWLSEDAGFVASKNPDGTSAVRSTDTGEMTYQAPAGWEVYGINPDGTQAMIIEDALEEGCDPRLVSTLDGSVDAHLVDGDCYFGIFSPDGSLVYSFTNALEGGGLGLFDTVSGELVGTPLEWARFGFGIGAAFTPDGSKLVASNGQGSVFIFDVAALSGGAPAEEALIREIPAHDSFVARLKVSPNGSMAATFAFTEPLKLWDLDTGQLVDRFGGRIEGLTFHDADFHPSLQHLLVTSPPNEVRIHTLDIDELVTIAQSRLSREMTEGECQQYFRRSCEGS